MTKPTTYGEAFEEYRAEKFGAYAEYPLDALTHFAAGWKAAVAAARAVQPVTAALPREDAYQHGRFDGVMDYGRAIVKLVQ